MESRLIGIKNAVAATGISLSKLEEQLNLAKMMKDVEPEIWLPKFIQLKLQVDLLKDINNLIQIEQYLAAARMMEAFDLLTWTPKIKHFEREVERWESKVLVANFSANLSLESLELYQKALNAHEIAERRRTNCIFTKLIKDEKNHQITILKEKILVKSELTTIEEE
jgi:hypothetical protein